VRILLYLKLLSLAVRVLFTAATEAEALCDSCLH